MKLMAWSAGLGALRGTTCSKPFELGSEFTQVLKLLFAFCCHKRLVCRPGPLIWPGNSGKIRLHAQMIVCSMKNTACQYGIASILMAFATYRLP